LNDLSSQIVIANDPRDEVVEAVEMLAVERSERSSAMRGG